MVRKWKKDNCCEAADKEDLLPPNDDEYSEYVEEEEMRLDKFGSFIENVDDGKSFSRHSSNSLVIKQEEHEITEHIINLMVFSTKLMS